MKPGFESKDVGSSPCAILDAVTWTWVWPSQRHGFLVCLNAEAVPPKVAMRTSQLDSLGQQRTVCLQDWPSRGKGFVLFCFFLYQVSKQFLTSKWVLCQCTGPVVIHLTPCAWDTMEKSLPGCYFAQISWRVLWKTQDARCDFWSSSLLCKRLKGSEVLPGAFQFSFLLFAFHTDPNK